MRKFFTSESVAVGHPDKVADQIADAILDEVLKQDPMARSAIEVTVSTGNVSIFGELSTTAYVNVREIATQTIKNIGYVEPKLGFTYDSVNISNQIVEQSKEISKAVSQADDDPDQLGAGDQGIIYGYADNETSDYIPLALQLSHKLMKQLKIVRQKGGSASYLRPDGKGEVSVEYGDDGKPKRISAVVLSAQHIEGIELEDLRARITEDVIAPVLPTELVDENTKFFINPAGLWSLGGPQADSGLTGRKIIVDTYGGAAHHGGGAFSGKDATKVDRSGAYYARYVAKNLVAAGLAEQLEIQVGYAIGVAQPVSINLDTFGTEKVPLDQIYAIIDQLFDFRPLAIINQLDLRRPIYLQTATFGHFGRSDLDLPWEKLDQVDKIKALIEK
ncbi:methionine adenosyltransferase [Oenococcus kitaharae]|uniref:S-adenosylmethionine synthase n=1 Tax=Oenococcus kitaharae DSM 17330 TaxID=1045004 RepID=G9WH96_9LACO|nr:methionine adenosyltransferase [Oenococcus kitaharae]EHN59662.1 S-adenosylmethionine synthetase [Oenococcus kitaharae DSM 17330]OEY83502.1 S-adenosylmethionine synthetase [Oenococcus kitaharae]OEY85301.1 S-adenosylmethionine synthetase [Oenococcus kitaharae]OEY86155.1 S-adenosylmethionine synthetase [Oenococcus kitaharae]